VPLKVAVDSVIGHRPVPPLLRAIVPSALRSSHFRLLVMVAVLQVLAVLLLELQAMASYFLHTQLGEQITLGFRTRLFRHVQRLSIQFHDRRGTADSIFRVQYDAPSLQWITTDGLIPLTASTVALVITLVVILQLSWPLAVVALAVCPGLFALGRFYNRRMRPRYKDVKGLESDAMGVVQEVLGALRVVKAFSREDREQKRFVDRSTAGATARVRLAAAEGAFGLAVNLITAVGTALVLFLGVREVQSRTLSLGQLLLVIAYLAELYAPLKTISQQVSGLQGDLASAERAFELLDEHPDVPERLGALHLGRACGQVQFERVSFAYEPGRPVLSEVSFVLDPGMRLRIAARTGAGKTTLVSLLTRFFDPNSGSILVDAVDLRDYRLADLRNQFSIVPQEPVLFSTSIAENVAYARPEASRADIEAAARAANAHDFIEDLPDGYSTLVGERGMRLSGGERQRVALARAFLKDAPILILDEPTSSVDVGTEAAIIEAMARLMAGRTVLMIAHRASALSACNALVEIREGRLVAAYPGPATHGVFPNVSRPPLDGTPLFYDS
jgi:ATP-binding cassette subfamily B protein